MEVGRGEGSGQKAQQVWLEGHRGAQVALKRLEREAASWIMNNLGNHLGGRCNHHRREDDFLNQGRVNDD